MGKLKSRYFYHEVATNKFCVCTVTGINTVTSEWSVYCCYFEADMEMNEKI